LSIQRSLVLVKPDGVARGLTGEVVSRFEKLDLKLVALRMLQMDKALAEKHYAVHRAKPFFNDLVKVITSGPVVAAVFEGENAIELIRKTMGSTDPSKAAKGTIRGDLGVSMERNTVHGSDAVETAQIEMALYFNDKDIVSYQRQSKTIE
jgi:nucleoside-diphosphate kinase